MLRTIQSSANFKILIAWMLTPDDGSSDGKYTTYLDEPEKWLHYDPELHRGIQQLINNNKSRSVSHIEKSGLLPDCTFFSDHTPDTSKERSNWFAHLKHTARECDLVFLDPDNGMEIKSRPYGKKQSNKFLFWQEVESLWHAGKSLLIYQYFIRQKRALFIQNRLEQLAHHTRGSVVEAFTTPRVLFLMALQPEHHNHHRAIINKVQNLWAGQIRHRDLVR